MKIRFDKCFTVIGVEEKISKERQNKYGVINVFDQFGEVNQLYVKGELLEQVKNLQYKDEVITTLELTANNKFKKLELLSLIRA